MEEGARMKRSLFLSLVVALAVGPAIRACTYCTPDIQQRQTLRQDARQAKFVVYGTLSNPRLNGDMGGSTDLNVEHVVKDDPARGKQQVITVSRYVPVDAKNPPRFLVFCDINNGRIDAYRGVPIKNTAVVEYLRGALAIPEKDRTKSLLHAFGHLDSSDPDVAADAFLEFAKATDQEIGEVARHLKPEKLRKLMTDPKTPAERLSVFAFLLGACGTKTDADLLSGMLAKNEERTAAATSGLLGGLIELRPQEGWEAVVRILKDPKRPFSQRLSALGALRFYHSWKPAETKTEVLRGLGALIEDGDMADMAIEDLRRWQWWELTQAILGQYGKPTHSAPLVRRAIIRYALCCPAAEATDFVKARRALESATVKEVEEGLAFEKGSTRASTSGPSNP
jgi:hypothetical protein